MDEKKYVQPVIACCRSRLSGNLAGVAIRQPVVRVNLKRL